MTCSSCSRTGRSERRLSHDAQGRGVRTPSADHPRMDQEPRAGRHQGSLVARDRTLSLRDRVIAGRGAGRCIVVIIISAKRHPPVPRADRVIDFLADRRTRPRPCNEDDARGHQRQAGGNRPARVSVPGGGQDNPLPPVMGLKCGADFRGTRQDTGLRMRRIQDQASRRRVADAGQARTPPA